MNVTEKLKFVLEKVENIVGKGGNAGYQHFLLYLQCFEKASFTRSLKEGLCGKELSDKTGLLKSRKHCGIPAMFSKGFFPRVIKSWRATNLC